MRSIIAISCIALITILAACAPSASQLRMQRVADAKVAAQLPGPRQAQDLAFAVHESYQAGDYKKQPQLLMQDLQFAAATIDRALPSAGADAPTLVAWRALMLADAGYMKDALDEFEKSFKMGPNKLAGRNLVIIYGTANNQQAVATTCQATFQVMTSDDDRLDLVAMCRKHMNALSPETEMSWMTQEQIAWYQAENAQRMQARIEAQQRAAAQQREENRVVRRAEQCYASCKERGLMCQNRCYGDAECDDRCVQANHACVNRCESAAYEELGQ